MFEPLVLRLPQLDEIIERQDRILAAQERITAKLAEAAGPAWYSLRTYAARLGLPYNEVANNAYLQPERRDGPNSRYCFWCEDVVRHCRMTKAEMVEAYRARLSGRAHTYQRASAGIRA